MTQNSNLNIECLSKKYEELYKKKEEMFNLIKKIEEKNFELEKNSLIQEKKIKEIEGKIEKLPILLQRNKILSSYHLNISKNNDINKKFKSFSILNSEYIISYSSSNIFILDNYFKILKKIKNEGITNISIKNENYFAACSNKVNIYYKNQNNFDLITSIEVKKKINQILYCSNNDIFILNKNDKTISLWSKENENYIQKDILVHEDIIKAIFYLEDKKYLISSGEKTTKIWDINNNRKCIKTYNNVECLHKNALNRLDENKIIVGGGYDGRMKILSIEDKDKITIINNGFKCYSICVIQEYNIFLIGGNNPYIKIYRIHDEICIQNIYYDSNDIYNIFDIVKLNDLYFATFANNKEYNAINKIWSIKI